MPATSLYQLTHLSGIELKRLALVFAVLAFASFANSDWAAAVRGPGHGKLYLHTLTRLSNLTNFVPAGMNGTGDIVGTATIDGHSKVVVLLHAGTHRSRLFVLSIPKGYASETAAGISERDWVAATAHKKHGLRDHDAPFVAVFNGSRFVWVRLPASRPGYGYRATGIAPDGDIAGTRVGKKANSNRAVLWVSFARHSSPPGAGPYGVVALLPLGHRYRQSQATAIWSRNSADVVVGVQGGSRRGLITVWSGHGRLSTRLVYSKSTILQPPVAVGGWGPHLYMIGSIFGVDTSGGWFIKIDWPIRSGIATPEGVTALARPNYAGAECFFGAQGVSAGLHGNFVGVGSISCIASSGRSPAATIWHGPNVQKIQYEAAIGTGWSLTNAYGVNVRGQILGSGTFRGNHEFFLLINT